ncbi:ABC transporter substrate-binding protein [Verticiella sediminum]|uniref:ABC transporter substrate-binding protein n=1 Tax=Verticiella sediminum TaxID=1247510 RepID=A0A556A947_9BURK|nr:tripartite tricarboxylate transporter substrate-binding protein [Verticiella sediminum]TSH89409.1 ABC transporter substrate-binding protein [Verticiella sediminum]
MRHTLRALCACLTLACAPALAAEPPLTLIVGYAPGGTSDRVARLVGDGLAKRLGTPVIVENRAGAGGRIAAQQLARAGADDNQLMLANPAVMVVAPLVYSNLGYDAAKDFQPVAMTASYRFALAVPAGSPIKNAKDLADVAAKDPAFNIGVPATGSLPHFFGLMLGEALQAQPEIIGYRGSAPLLTELLGGHIGYAIDTYDTLEPQHAAGKVRIVAVSGTQRDTAQPDVPTFKESGIDLDGEGWNAFFASAAMPKEKVERLGREIAEIVASPAFAETARAQRLEPVEAGPARTGEIVQAFNEQWAPVIQASGFKATD